MEEDRKMERWDDRTFIGKVIRNFPFPVTLPAPAEAISSVRHWPGEVACQCSVGNNKTD